MAKLSREWDRRRIAALVRSRPNESRTMIKPERTSTSIARLTGALDRPVRRFNWNWDSQSVSFLDPSSWLQPNVCRTITERSRHSVSRSRGITRSSKKLGNGVVPTRGSFDLFLIGISGSIIVVFNCGNEKGCWPPCGPLR